MGIIRASKELSPSKSRSKPRTVSFDNPRENIDPHVRTKVVSTQEARIGAYTMPTADGTANQIIETDGAGALSWVDKPTQANPGEGHITLIPPAYERVDSGTWVIGNHNDAYYLGRFFYNSSGGDGDSVSYETYLAAGTYTFFFLAVKAGNRGILDIDIEGTEVASFDQYDAGGGYQYYLEETGITVATSGIKTITFRVDGRNGSSSGYYSGWSFAALWRTA